MEYSREYRDDVVVFKNARDFQKSCKPESTESRTSTFFDGGLW